MQKITYKRKRFYIELRSENGSRQPNTVGFHMDSYDGCKQLWKSCIEYNAFFRWARLCIVTVLTGSCMHGRVVTHTLGLIYKYPFLGKGHCHKICKLWYCKAFACCTCTCMQPRYLISMDDTYLFVPPPPTQSIWCACPAPCPHIQFPTSSHILEGADGATPTERTTGNCSGAI